jgi:hypothetical protein
MNTDPINNNNNKVKDKAIPLQARTGPEGSRRLRYHISKQSAQENGNVVLVHISDRGCVKPRAIVHPEGSCQ